MAVANIRMPDEVYERIKTRASVEGRSINQVAVEVLDREMRRWLANWALAEAERIQNEIYVRCGELPDSTELIRRLREERSERG